MTTIEITEIQDLKTVIISMSNAPANAFTKPFLTELSNAMRKYNEAKEFHSIILTSSMKAFSVGGDLVGMKNGINKGIPEEYVTNIVPFVNEFILQILDHSLPIIAVINGSIAGGGLSFGLACDYRIAHPNVKFAFAFGKVGLTPDSGTSVLVPDRFNLSTAFLGFSLGKVYSSQEALTHNAIHEICEPNSAMESAKKLARSFSEMDRWTTSKTKSLVNYKLIKELNGRANIEYQTIISASKQPMFSAKLNEMLNRLKSK